MVEKYKNIALTIIFSKDQIREYWDYSDLMEGFQVRLFIRDQPQQRQDSGMQQRCQIPQAEVACVGSPT